MSESASSAKTGDVGIAIEQDLELQAMRVVLGALVPLKRDGRTRVLDYVLNRLGMAGENPAAASSSPVSAPVPTESPSAGAELEPNDIRSLKEEKNPRTANQMAALVAYYLSEMSRERQDSIAVEDIRRYFREAKFPLPTKPEQTLINAKAAGYFERLGNGRYKLNSVGYNLVVHKLPSPDDAAPTARGRGKWSKPAKRSR